MLKIIIFFDKQILNEAFTFSGFEKLSRLKIKLYNFKILKYYNIVKYNINLEIRKNDEKDAILKDIRKS